MPFLGMHSEFRDVRARARRLPHATETTPVMERSKPPATKEKPSSKARRAVMADASGMKAEVAALKRERILETATQRFLRYSFHGCSMDAIAQGLGVTKPFIYYQFRDKGDILAAICSQGAELSLSALDQARSE